MAVYFAPQRRNYLLESLVGLGQELAKQQVSAMYDRDKYAREVRQSQKANDNAANLIWGSGGASTNPSATLSVESYVPEQKEPGLFSSLDFSGGKGIEVSSGVNASAVSPMGMGERAFRGARFYPSSQQQDYHSLMKTTAGKGVENEENVNNAQRVAQILGPAPDVTNRQAWSQYFANAAPYLSDAKTKALGSMQEHLTPVQKMNTLDLGDRQSVVAFDPATGKVNTSLTENVNVSPDVALRINAQKYVADQKLEGQKLIGKKDKKTNGIDVDNVFSQFQKGNLLGLDGALLPGQEEEAAKILSKATNIPVEKWKKEIVDDVAKGNTFNVREMLKSFGG